MDCPYCGKLLATWWAYERHIGRFHYHELPELNREQALKQASVKLSEILGKKKSGRKRKVQQCETCRKIFKSRPALTYHVAVKHSSTVYTCDFCPAVFPHPMLLKSHVLRHGERTVMCHRCGRKFFTQKQLNSHENLFHRRARSYSCRTCKVQFSTQRALQHHLKTQPHDKFCCQECGMSFDHKKEYLSHVVNHSLKCILCKQSFKSAVAAHQHYVSTHASKSDPQAEESLQRLFTQKNSAPNTTTTSTTDSITLLPSIVDKSVEFPIPCIQTYITQKPTSKDSDGATHTVSAAQSKVNREVIHVKGIVCEDASLERQFVNNEDFENEQVIIIVSPGGADEEIPTFSQCSD